MNILHMKYAVEVANAGSINKASEKLLVAQPNLSRSIKELESDLGIVIFDRSSRGMVLTPEGDEFIRHAKKIIRDIEDVERMFRPDRELTQKLRVVAPMVSYVSDAFVRFSESLSADFELSYKETDPQGIITAVSSDEYDFGVIRFASVFDRYFKAIFEERGLASEQLSEVPACVIAGADSPLVSMEEITLADLEELIEVKHADPYIPSLPMAMVKKESLPSNTSSRIYVSERATQFELLASDGRYFMWGSAVPGHIMDRYGLVERECADFKKTARDVIIYRRTAGLSPLARRFADMLKEEGKRVGI